MLCHLFLAPVIFKQVEIDLKRRGQHSFIRFVPLRLRLLETASITMRFAPSETSRTPRMDRSHSRSYLL